MTRVLRVALLTFLTLLGGCDATLMGSGVLAATAIALGLKKSEKKEPLVNLSAAALTFEPQPIAEPSGSQTITVSNNGKATLTVSTVTVTGVDAASFSQTNDCVSVAVGASCTVTVIFSPASLGDKTASVSIAHNAPTTPTTIKLTGVGKDLVISEIGNCFTNSACWFEIYNPTTTKVDLSKYIVRTEGAGGPSVTVLEFSLPAVEIAADAYVVVLGNSANWTQRGKELLLVRQTPYIPSWKGSAGFIELTKSNATMDFVLIGQGTFTPLTTSQWSGAGVTGLTSTVPDGYGRSVVRPYPKTKDTDSNAATDWVAVDWATPGGRNDIPAGTLDEDTDGIPDSAEASGGTYAGLDLYAMGARTNRKDIFVEVDHMMSTDPAVIPQRASLQLVTESFAKKNIGIHFDAGSDFSASFSTTSFNLGQKTSTVPYEKCVFISGSSQCSGNSSTRREILDWKREFMELRRTYIFHYMLFGNSILPSGSCGPSGIAELKGNDLLVTIGSCGLSNADETSLNVLINFHAGTIMHELGHNLGLLHGGNENQNYKPNHLSIMNYLYQLEGLEPDPTSSTAFERWRTSFGDGSPGRCNLRGSPCGAPADFVISYSDGSSEDFDENALLESKNLGRGVSSGAYADWDLNGQLTTATQAKDLNNNGSRTILKDFDDWGNLVLPFARYSSGTAGRITIQENSNAPRLDPLANDRQEIVNETLTVLPRRPQ